jgi:hypothetical protein
MAKKPEESTKTDVAVVAAGAATAPSFIDDADFGGGFEGADKDSFAIPFLQILQKMSPMVDEDDAKHIEGAKAGMLYNTVTQKLYDGKEGIKIVPCFYRRSFIQWGGREAADGGFKGEFTPEQINEMVANGDIIAVDGKLLKPLADGTTHEKKSDYFADTRSHYVLIVDEVIGEIGQAILALASSQVKASKMLMTALQQKKVDTSRGKQTPPTFANLVKVTTFGQSNDKGSWSAVRFDLEGLVTDAGVFNEAKAFYKAIVAGEVTVDHNKSGNSDTGNVSDAPGTAEQF